MLFFGKNEHIYLQQRIAGYLDVLDLISLSEVNQSLLSTLRDCLDVQKRAFSVIHAISSRRSRENDLPKLVAEQAAYMSVNPTTIREYPIDFDRVQCVMGGTLVEDRVNHRDAPQRFLRLSDGSVASLDAGIRVNGHGEGKWAIVQGDLCVRAQAFESQGIGSVKFFFQQLDFRQPPVKREEAVKPMKPHPKARYPIIEVSGIDPPYHTNYAFFFSSKFIILVFGTYDRKFLIILDWKNGTSVQTPVAYYRWLSDEVWVDDDGHTAYAYRSVDRQGVGFYRLDDWVDRGARLELNIPPAPERRCSVQRDFVEADADPLHLDEHRVFTAGERHFADLIAFSSRMNPLGGDYDKTHAFYANCPAFFGIAPGRPQRILQPTRHDIRLFRCSLSKMETEVYDDLRYDDLRYDIDIRTFETPLSHRNSQASSNREVSFGGRIIFLRSWEASGLIHLIVIDPNTRRVRFDKTKGKGLVNRELLDRLGSSHSQNQPEMSWRADCVADLVVQESGNPLSEYGVSVQLPGRLDDCPRVELHADGSNLFVFASTINEYKEGQPPGEHKGFYLEFD